ncbi:MAG: hypothetical protein N2170_08050, partial [Bacteroidia bacterium]|nr:hypothetical protein [Bacteroidia bacterium]
MRMYRCLWAWLRKGTIGGTAVLLYGQNVGISTTTPATRLHVAGANAALTVGPFGIGQAEGRIVATGATNEISFVRRNLTSWPGAAAAAGDRYAWYSPDGSARLWTPVNGDLVTVTAAGNVGIGTITPSERLHVQGNLRLQGAFMPNNNAGMTGQILVSQGSGVPPIWQNLATLLFCGGFVVDRITKFTSSGVCNTTLIEDVGGHIWNVDGSATQPGLPTNAGSQHYIPAVTRAKFSIVAPGWNPNRIHGIVARGGFMNNLLGGPFRGIGVVGLTQDVAVEYGMDAPGRFYYDPNGAGGAFFSTYYGVITMATGAPAGAGDIWGGGIVSTGGGASQRAVGGSYGGIGVGRQIGVAGVGEIASAADGSVGIVGTSHQGHNTAAWSYIRPAAGAGGAFSSPYFAVAGYAGNNMNVNSAAGLFVSTQPGWNEVRVAHHDYATNTFYKIRGPGVNSTVVWNPDKTQQHTFFSPEAPEILFMDRGVAQLKNGYAYVQLDELFS